MTPRWPNLRNEKERAVRPPRGRGEGSDGDEWKDRLLDLLGGGDVDGEDGGRPGGGAGAPDGRPSDIDVLLSKSSCERFVLRCVENELPPNLIHCLRLLRVLELQYDFAAACGDYWSLCGSCDRLC